MAEFLICMKMVTLILCGDFNPICVDTFESCMLEKENTKICAGKIGQITDMECEWLLE